MGGCARSSLSGVPLIFLICCAHLPGGDRSSDDARSRTEYQQVLERYSQSAEGLKLVVTVIDDEDTVPRNSGAPIPREASYHGCQVFGTGEVVHFSVSEMGGRGSGDEPVSPVELRHLDDLLTNLPEDGGRLPPPGRRMLLQAFDGKGPTSRVYDRANAPDSVLEILRLSNSRISPWTLRFKPESEIDAHYDGFLCLSPDQKQILFAGPNGALEFWEPVTHEPLGDVKTDGISLNEIKFSPDGKWAAVAGFGECSLLDTSNWKEVRRFEEPWIDRTRRVLSDPQFTPDGKYLLLQCSEPSLRIFETRTWLAVANAADVPRDAVQYIPAPKCRRAIVRSKTGVILLWDPERHMALRQLDKDCHVQEAAFSPDETLVAVVTTDTMHWNGYGGKPRLRLWKVNDGELVRELRPVEQSGSQKVRYVTWSPDIHYLLAAWEVINGGTEEEICMWDVRTGRHRATFGDCHGRITGVVLLHDGSEIVAGSDSGKIQFWDFASAVKQIREFEDSLRVR